ncbi:MAG: RluA family pseudouridine synthase [Patescibacteria group bacterium]
MTLTSLFEDNDLLVIDKPAGTVVNRAESVKGETVQDWAEEKLKVGEEDFYRRAGIVHRLDKETSGILLLAKTPAAFAALQRQFKERLVKKTYLALVHGKLVPPVGEIRAPVGRLPWNRERFGIVPGGKEAVTKYKVISNRRVQSEELTLVELYPETGRTHQIRVHLKYINHPIVGDYLYAGRKVSRADRTWAPRVMLHASKITFRHPTSDVLTSVEAPLPRDMRAIISRV